MQLLLPLRNRLLMWLCSAPLLVPAAHLLGLFTYGDFSTRRSLLIDYFMTAFVVGIWIGVHGWWREKDIPPIPIRKPAPQLPLLQWLIVYSIASVRAFVYYLVFAYIYSELMNELAREIFGGGLFSLSLGFALGYWLIGRYFFVVPKSPGWPPPARR